MVRITRIYEVKAKLSLHLIKHRSRKTCGGDRVKSTAPLIHKLCNQWCWVTSVAPYPQKDTCFLSGLSRVRTRRSVIATEVFRGLPQSPPELYLPLPTQLTPHSSAYYSTLLKTSLNEPQINTNERHWSTRWTVGCMRHRDYVCDDKEKLSAFFENRTSVVQSVFSH